MKGRALAAVEESSDWREILPGLTMGSQLRLQTESRRNSKFDGTRAGNDEDYLLSRFRFDLTWKPSDRVSAIVELQDARIHGEQAISETRTPNIFADQLDIHQAYLDVGSPASGTVPISLRIGRQKLVYGAQRMVSPLEWVNTARVFDGGRIGIGVGPGRKLDAFATRLVPVTPTGLNDHGPTGSRMFNSQLHGVYYTDTTLVAGSTVEGTGCCAAPRASTTRSTPSGRVSTLATAPGRSTASWPPRPGATVAWNTGPRWCTSEVPTRPPCRAS